MERGNKKEEKHPNSQLSTGSGCARLTLGLLEGLLRLLCPLVRGLRGPLGSLLQFSEREREEIARRVSEDLNRSHLFHLRKPRGQKDGADEDDAKKMADSRHQPSPRPWQP